MIGDDCIQSSLDGAAMVRVVVESTLPQGWTPRGIGLAWLPYKIGHGYFIEGKWYLVATLFAQPKHSLDVVGFVRL